MENVEYGGRTSRIVIGLVVLGLFGCGSSAGSGTGIGRDESQKLKALANLYSSYVGENRGKPTLNEQDFREFIATKEKFWKQLASSADELLRSPRTGENFVILYQKDLPKGPQGVYFFAFEKTGIDGKHMVLGSRAYYELMDEQQVRSLFAKSGVEF